MARISRKVRNINTFVRDAGTAREVVFIDPATPDGHALAAAARAGVDIVMLPADRDPLARIAACLAGRDYQAVHIVAHGAPGRIAFAFGSLSLDTLEAHARSLSGIRAALEHGAEIDLWSCETGQGEAGREFVDALAEATGALVASSTRAVGAADLGGHWTLDTGPAGPAAAPFAPEAIAAYRGLLGGKLYYTTQSGASDSFLHHVNVDGTNNVSQVQDTTAGSPWQETVIDVANDRYFTLEYSYGLYDHGVLYTGRLNSSDAPTAVLTFSGANDVIDNIAGLEIDPVNHQLYFSRTDYVDDVNYAESAATSGILQIDYDPATGALSNTTNYLINDTQAQTPHGYFAATDIGIDDTDGTVYYVNQSAGLGNNMIYKVDAATHTVTTLLDQSQFPEISQFAPGASNGIIRDVEVDGSRDLVYFSVGKYDNSANPAENSIGPGSQNQIYVIADTATGGTAATVVTLTGLSANFIPGNITLDQANHVLYVASEEGLNDSPNTDDLIYSFQLSADGLSGTFIRSFTPGFGSHDGNIGGLEFVGNAAAMLDLDANSSAGVVGTGFQASYAEDGSAAAIADIDVSITDDDANVASATVTLTNHQAGDVLAVSGGLPTGIVASAYNSSTGVLTLSGSTTLANYQTALHQIQFSSTSDTPVTTDRTITVTVNDGTVNSAPATSTIHVAASNDAPVLSGSGAVSGNEDSDIAVTGISAADVDADPATQDVSLTLTVASGTLDVKTDVVGGLVAADVTGDVSGTVTLVGTLNEINATLGAANGLVFHGAQHFNGTRDIGFTLDDLGHSGGGGSETDTGTSVVAITVNAVNDAPVATGTAALAAVNEDDANPAGATVSSLFSANFSDALDNVSGGSSADGFAGIVISDYNASAARGDWQYSDDGGTTWTSIGSATATTAVEVAAADLLRFLPAANYNGPATTLLANLVETGQALTSGTVLDLTGLTGGDGHISAAPVVFGGTVDSVNDAPSGADNTITLYEDDSYTFTSNDFGFSDTDDGDALLNVVITTAPTHGILYNGATELQAGDTVSIADIGAGNFAFLPDLDGNGAAYASFTFQVQDDGGTLNGGADTDPVANTITFDVTPVNDAPRIFLQPSLDIVAALPLDNGVDIVIGDGNGGSLGAYSEPAGAAPADVVLADFDNDGDLDIATANYIDNSVSVFQVDDCGCIDEATSSPISVSGPTRALVAGDFNADGKVDLLVAAEGAGLTELLGNGDGTFAIGAFLSTPDAYDVAVADIDGDGVLDAVTSGGSGTGLAIFHSGSGAAFSLTGSAQVNSGFPIGIALDDVNGDGDADIVTANGNGTASILLGAGDGTFGAATDLTIGNGDNFLALGDLDGDSDVDIVVSNQGVNTVSVLVNQGGGVLAPQVTYAVGSSPAGVALGDMDGDGHLDIVVGNAGAQTYSVLHGVGDGTFAGGDIIAATGSMTNIALGNIDAMVEDLNPIVRTFVEGGTLALAPHLVLRDDDGAGVAGATVFVSGGLAGDVLAANTSGTTIVAFYDSATTTLTLTGTAADTLADYQQVLRTVTFSSGDDPDDHGNMPARVIGMTVDDGALNGETNPPAAIFMGIVAVDDQSSAVNDMFFTDENTKVTGHNVFDANTVTPDSDPDSDLTVATVNGLAGNVATQITLASGALLTLNADGTFEYDPNGAFRYVPGPLSGASNHVVTDSFTYALADGSSATVTVAVTGIDTGGDILQGTAGSDILDGGIGNDTMYGGAGSDVYTVDASGDIVDESVGGSGFDRISSYLSWGLASANVHGTVEVLELVGGADLNATGDNLANTLIGNSGDNGLNGRGGLDILQGGLGDDTYYLANGSDIVSDIGGYDTISSSISRSLVGYAGIERLVLGEGSGALVGTGNDLDNSIYGNSDDNGLRGGLGNDLLVGGMGNDTYLLEDGHDAIVEAPSPDGGYDTISTTISRSLADFTGVERLVLGGAGNINGVGNAGDNAIYGNAGNNIIDGGDGGDYLVGGLGKDTLTGDGSSDRFVFTSAADSGTNASTRDLITDFVHGLDTIYLSAIDATGSPGSAFTFIADAVFSHVAGELRYFQADYAQDSRDVTVVEGDINGDGVADFQIGVAGLTNMVLTDFIL